MKRVLFAFVLLWLPQGRVRAEDPVHFPDAKLKAVVEEHLWLSDPTPTDMLQLTSLHAAARGISNITGLEYATNLQTLVLRWNQIYDISALSGLDELEELDAHDNFISDISALSGKSRLWKVILRYNKIEDISALTDLTSLQQLDLRANPLNEYACTLYIPQILANNPGLSFDYDPCVTRRLSVSSGTGGSVINPGEGEFTYDNGASVRVEAVADSDFVFLGWVGTHADSRNPATVVMDQDHEIRATFANLLDPNWVDDPADDPDPDPGDDPKDRPMPPAGYSEILYVDAAAVGDPGPGDPNVSDPLEDGSESHPFDRIQEALDAAALEGVYILVRSGTYPEDLDLLGKRVALVGIDPRASVPQPYPVLAGSGTGPAVRFVSGEDRSCLMQGFVITADSDSRGAAIMCRAASPTIANCLIVGSRTSDANGAAVYCENSRALLTNCTIADNRGGSRGAGMYAIDSEITLSNSILWNNAPLELLVEGTGRASIRHCDIAGGWFGTGNLDVDPLFARAGSWVSVNDPDVVPGSAGPATVWVEGDYHLQSQAGRWDPDAGRWDPDAGRWDPDAGGWVQDPMTSFCIDAGDVYRPVGDEPSPNGGLVNIGAYGGTVGASKSWLSKPTF